jgi:hypothetical protein
MKMLNQNDYIKKLLDDGFKAWSETSLTAWPEDAPKLGIKKNEYCITRTYKHGNTWDPDCSYVTLYYIFAGYRSPALPENADRINAYSEPGGQLTVIK